MSGPRGAARVHRDCRALAVPSGQPIVLRAGEEVAIVQSLGHSITVRTAVGLLARIEGRDAGVLGLGPPVSTAREDQASGPGSSDSAVAAFDLELVVDQLRQVYDPEIPVNVVDLGLVYRCEARPAPGGYRVEVDLSMTAPGCGMGDILREEVAARAMTVPGVREVNVELVWDPPWDLSRLSEAARLELGLM